MAFIDSTGQILAEREAAMQRRQALANQISKGLQQFGEISRQKELDQERRDRQKLLDQRSEEDRALRIAQATGVNPMAAQLQQAQQADIEAQMQQNPNFEGPMQPSPEVGGFGNILEQVASQARQRRDVEAENRDFQRSQRMFQQEEMTKPFAQTREAEKIKFTEGVKSQSALKKAQAQATSQLPIEQRKLVAGLRKEISSNPATRDLNKIDAAFGKVESAAKKASAAGDIALVFNFMKMLDPGSTVREGEFANAARAAGLPDRIVNYANRIDKGLILNPEQRQDFLNVSRETAKAQFENYQRSIAPQLRAAQESGIDTSLILPSFSPSRFGSKEKTGISAISSIKDPKERKTALQSLSSEDLDKMIRQLESNSVTGL